MFKFTTILFFSFSSFALQICACQSVSKDEDIPENLLQEGKASWYGPGFDGQLTSSRERFDQTKFTAAHRTLPFGTVVEVINLENNLTVEVEINDRGPYAGNRIIDLSKAAAEEINLLDSGVAEVQLVLIEAGGEIPEDLNQPTYTLQIGEYNLTSYAKAFADSVGEGVRIEQEFGTNPDRTIYMIYYGNYARIDSARSDLDKLKERGLDGFVKQVN